MCMEENQKKLQAQIESLEKRIHFLKNNQQPAQNLDQLQQQVGALQNSVSQIGNTVQSLHPVATTGDYNQLENLPALGNQSVFAPLTHSTANFFLIAALPNTSVENLSTDKLWFVCEPDAYIEGNFSINYRYNGKVNITTTMKLMFNNEVLKEIPITIPNYATHNMVVDFKIYPTQKINCFYFVVICTTNGRAMIDNVQINITKAKNVFFLNRDYTKTVFVYKHKYYITENTNFYNKYHILDANNFDFSNPQTPAYDFGPCQITFPAAKYSNGVCTINEEDYFLAVRHYSSLGIKIAKVLVMSNVSSFNFLGHGYGVSYFKQGTAYSPMPTVTGVFTENARLGYLFGNSYINRTDFVEYTLNGQPIEGCWVENVPVHQLDMDNAPIFEFQGSVGVRNDGQCFFFDHYNATQMLPLGFGRMPSVFRQQNGNIHIYIGKINCVNKIVLAKNTSTNKFEIVSQQTIYGAEQYYETLDNKAIIIIDGQIKLIDA